MFATPMASRPPPVDVSDSMELILSPIPKSQHGIRKEKYARIIQSAWQSCRDRKRGKCMLNLWPSLSELRKLYLDEGAINAGAKGSVLYTDEMIIQREMLRKDPLVRRALEYFWSCIPKAESDRLSKEECMCIARKLYLIICLEQGETPNPASWRPSAESDFESDSSVRGFLSQDDALRSWFQLADLHTDDVSGVAYAGWLRRKAQQMTCAYSGEGAQVLAAAGVRVREWRDDSEIMALASISESDRVFLEKEAGRGGSPSGRHLLRRGSLPPVEAKEAKAKEAPAAVSKQGAAGSQPVRTRRGSLPPVTEAPAAGTKARKQAKLKPVKSAKQPAKPVEVFARLRWFGAYADLRARESEWCKEHARRLLGEMVAEEEKRKKRASKERMRRASKELAKENVAKENVGGLLGRAITAVGALSPRRILARDPDGIAAIRNRNRPLAPIPTSSGALLQHLGGLMGGLPLSPLRRGLSDTAR